MHKRLLRAVLTRALDPVSYCASCRRPWFTDKRHPCECGATARLFDRSLLDLVVADDRLN